MFCYPSPHMQRWLYRHSRLAPIGATPCLALQRRRCCCSSSAFITPGMPSRTTSLSRNGDNRRPSAAPVSRSSTIGNYPVGSITAILVKAQPPDSPEVPFEAANPVSREFAGEWHFNGLPTRLSNPRERATSHLHRWAFLWTWPAAPRDLARARSGGKFVVSSSGEAYEATLLQLRFMLANNRCVLYRSLVFAAGAC